MDAEVHMTFLCCWVSVKYGMAEPGGAEIRERPCARRKRPRMTLSLAFAGRIVGWPTSIETPHWAAEDLEQPCVRGWCRRVTPSLHGTPGNVVSQQECRSSWVEALVLQQVVAIRRFVEHFCGQTAIVFIDE
ncbi:hypothetical protein NDU88_011989 [Pleurodeles waltl]|uniref:Uncharacterized protein n=1 Tax=Pleurodeles waltl TaxID=8319 RepID=A0AAV7S5W9_PLEWA|nr:hypothetical protein NDU88_011989 [Pleurodeles waltl]